ncbi:hypothetical protein ACU4GH_07030 [Bradyrhizobium betae]
MKRIRGRQAHSKSVLQSASRKREAHHGKTASGARDWRQASATEFSHDPHSQPPGSPTATVSNALRSTHVLQGVPFYSGVALMIDADQRGRNSPTSRYRRSHFHCDDIDLPCPGESRGSAPRFPHFFRHSHEPLFADPALSFAEKVSRWLAQPKTALQLLTNSLLLSMLAVGVASIR